MPPLPLPPRLPFPSQPTEASLPPVQDSAPSLRALLPSAPPLAPLWDDEPLAEVRPEEASSLLASLHAPPTPAAAAPAPADGRSPNTQASAASAAATPRAKKPLALGLAALVGASAIAIVATRPDAPVPVKPVASASPAGLASAAGSAPSSVGAASTSASASASTPAPREELASKLSRPSFLVAGSSAVYLVTSEQKNEKAPVLSTVLAVPKTGGKPKVVVAAQPPIGSLRLDPEKKHLYFTAQPKKRPATAHRVPVAGGFPLRLYGQPVGDLVVVGVDAKRAYLRWTNEEDGGLLSIPRQGGLSKPVFKGVKLVEADVGATFAAGCNAAVAKFALTGPRSEEILERFDTGACDALAVDEGHVYFAHEGALKVSDFSATSVLHGGVRARALRATATHLYWVSESGAGTYRLERSLKKAGSPVELLVDGLKGELAFDVDDSHLYVAEREVGTLSRVALPR
jgi:hypothetical protein